MQKISITETKNYVINYVIPLSVFNKKSQYLVSLTKAFYEYFL